MNMENIASIINSKTLPPHTVNSNEKYTSTVNRETVTYKIQKVIDQENITPEGIAKLLSEGLDDHKSERYYFILASEIPHAKLMEALHITKEAAHRKTIRYKPTYFQGILKNWGIKTKFSGNKNQ